MASRPSGRRAFTFGALVAACARTSKAAASASLSEAAERRRNCAAMSVRARLPLQPSSRSRNCRTGTSPTAELSHTRKWSASSQCGRWLSGKCGLTGLLRQINRISRPHQVATGEWRVDSNSNQAETATCRDHLAADNLRSAVHLRYQPEAYSTGFDDQEAACRGEEAK